MFRLNLKIALRNLWKYKGYTSINVLGLSIGMASCILIFIFIRYQLSYDTGFKHKDRIYRVVTNWKYNSFDDCSAGVPYPFTQAARNELTGIEKIAAITKRWGIVHVKDQSGKELIKKQSEVYYTESSFFQIFDVKWQLGEPLTALKEPNTVALSESRAITYFGSAKNAIGKNITLDTRTHLKVTGVFSDLPTNTSFPLNIVISHQTLKEGNTDCWDCVNSSSSSYLLLKEGFDEASMQPALDQFNKKYYHKPKISGNQNNQLQALKDIHFDERYDNFADTSIGRYQIYGLGIIGLFLIVTACINFINLNTAQAVNRSKEVGVRKVMGGMRKQLIVQFLTETFVITFIALLIACVFSELMLPVMHHLFKNQVSLSLFGHPLIFVFMMLLVIFVSFLAGFYPALIMSGFNPALAIKNKMVLNNNGLSLRKILVVAQFSITIILIISTLVVVYQMKYVQQKTLGFKTNEVVMIGIPGDSVGRSKQQIFKDKVMQIPGVKMLSYCMAPPLSNDINSTNFTFNNVKNKDFELRTVAADENYFDLFDIKLIAGKVYAKSDTVNGYVVNETFIRKLNINNAQDALGKMIDATGRNLPIVGVAKDFNDKSLKESISGLVIYPRKGQYWNAAVKVDGKQLPLVMKQLETIWNENFPNGIYEANFLNDKINNYYESERITGVLFKLFAGVIIFISFIGLFGLISFVATQRTKEMAIRKVLGATTFELVKMLNSSFLLMVFVANLIAWPLAYLFASNWLSSFAYRMELSIWPFLLAMFITMLITLITVSIRSYKAAVANTIDALKYE
ncbi:ABC transporter permease [Pedobacter sp. Hv1]|uniref:ABC transporter permease n=1 Tax=Pedobacter sp. Hv1 TaxID=1740090 RepID=UPI0006D896AE|nr:ABC transporter permease [Pedobacter sp. Hv1]KQC01682.1 ABC transporter permease [Pedobacter sp. Hv1]